MKGQGMKGLGKNIQSGFTLIELIVVILGILSAVAIPRFADLGSEARTASLEGLAGAMKSSSAIVHAKWLASGNVAPVVVEGANVTVNAAGYPDALVAGIATAAQIDPNDYAHGADNAGATIAYTIQANCFVTYNAGVSPPTAIVTSGGC